MQEPKLYEYAVIRLVPKPEREEFFNVGLIMFSKKEKFIRVKSPFVMIKDHVLLPQASELDEVNERFKAILTDDVLREIVELIPEDWLHWNDTDLTPTEIKDVYFQFLILRRDNSDNFLNEAKNARAKVI